MAKTIEKKFKKKHEFNVRYTQIITHYENFPKLQNGNYLLAIYPKERNSQFNAYWQGGEIIDDKTQKIYLQVKFSEGPIKTEKVVEYIFPLEGQIKEADFEKAKNNEFFFD